MFILYTYTMHKYHLPLNMRKLRTKVLWTQEYAGFPNARDPAQPRHHINNILLCCKLNYSYNIGNRVILASSFRSDTWCASPKLCCQKNLHLTLRSIAYYLCDFSKKLSFLSLINNVGQ